MLLLQTFRGSAASRQPKMVRMIHYLFLEKGKHKKWFCLQAIEPTTSGFSRQNVCRIVPKFRI